MPERVMSQKPLAAVVFPLGAFGRVRSQQSERLQALRAPSPIRELEVTIAHRTYVNLIDVFQTDVCCRSLSTVVKRAHARGAAALNYPDPPPEGRPSARRKARTTGGGFKS